MADRVSARPPASHPERIGRYRVIRCIGRGGGGVVYEARDEVMDRPVALKVLIQDFQGDPDARARFQREAQAAARLVHPNIITIYDAGEDHGHSFIAMQLLEGQPLADYMKSPEAAPLERKLDLMVQVCEGLTVAHGDGIVHRDLKPTNLFVQSDGLLKIYDFGVARLAESSMTAVGTMIGTPDYMSPEQARGEPVDTRSDIFSIGAVFYFILSGHKPFRGPDLPAVLHQLQFSEPAPLSADSVPPDLAALVMRAMAKSPAERPPRIEEVLAGLVRFRRQYQAETRRLSALLRARFDVIATLAETVAAEAAALGLPGDRDAATPTEHLSIMARLESASAEAMSLDRGRVTAILHELEAERQRLTGLQDGRRAHAAQLETGKQLLASGDAIAALKQFELVAAAYPSAELPRTLADGCRAQARKQEARDRRLAELTRQARSAIDAGEWATAIALCDEALQVLPRHELATALLAEAHQLVARERRRQEEALERTLDRATHAIDQHQFEIAAAALKEAEAIRPEAPAIGELRRRLTEAVAAVEAAELLDQMSADEIRRARAAFRRGRYDEAVQQLRAFLDSEPEAARVVDELNRLVRLRERVAGSWTARHAKVVALLAAARPLADRQQLVESLALVHEALSVDPTDAGAAAMFDELAERDLTQRLAAEVAATTARRDAQAAPLMTAAREAAKNGYLAVALGAAEAALRVAPKRVDAIALVADIRTAIAVDDVETVTLAEMPLPEPAADRPPAAPAPAQRPDPGVLSHVNQWAADLFRGRPAKH